MRIWVILLLFMGFPLAQGTLAPSSEADHWRASGIDTHFVLRFVKNEHCRKSPTWREACDRAIRMGFKFVESEISAAQMVDEFSRERQAGEVDYEAWVRRLEVEPTTQLKAMVWGYMANAVMTRFDAHSHIVPMSFGFLTTTEPVMAVGSGIQAEVNGSTVTVRKVLAPSPAAEAGIAVNDRILAIDGRSLGEGVHAQFEVDALNRGKERGITLSVWRGGVLRERKLVIERREVPSVDLRELTLFHRKYFVITLSVFTPGSCKLVQDGVLAAETANADGLILDLRFNPGGITDEARCVGQIFAGEPQLMSRYFFSKSLLPEELGLEPIMYGGSGIVPGYRDLRPKRTAEAMPLHVLINYRTASVAEMVAAGLQDMNRAWITGERSFGKGTFQLNAPLRSEPRLRLRHSIFQVVRRSGLPLQNHGVTPNFEVPFEAAAFGKKTSFPREEQVFSYAPLAMTEGEWSETRGDRHQRIEKCALTRGWARRFSRELRKLDGFEDYQQAFAMAALHCESRIPR